MTTTHQRIEELFVSIVETFGLNHNHHFAYYVSGNVFHAVVDAPNGGSISIAMDTAKFDGLNDAEMEKVILLELAEKAKTFDPYESFTDYFIPSFAHNHGYGSSAGYDEALMKDKRFFTNLYTTIAAKYS